MQRSKVRHIATSHRGRIFASGEFERRVQIWDLQSRQRVSEFDTILDFGGVRLAISEDGNHCVAGAYERHGLALYDATGRLKWQRKDLKKVQYTGFGRNGDTVLASFDDRPLHRLRTSDGETLATYRGLRWIEESPHSDALVLEKETAIELEGKGTRRTLAKLGKGDLHPFYLLGIALSRTSVTLYDFKLQLSCYALSDGQLTWRHVLPRDVNVQSLAYHEREKEIVGVTWPYLHGGNKSILAVDNEDGNLRRMLLLEGQPAETEFAIAGSCLITSEGYVVDTQTGELVARLDFPMESVST